MFTLLVGTPGSGKTLYAIDKILKISKNELEEFKNIKYVYTNISGFKFDKFEDSPVVFKNFSMKSFYDHLENLFSIYNINEDKEDLDDLLQDYCRENQLLDCYFIIDEAHNHFDNQDKIKMWWLTYHRHLNHEILFITQNKSIINTQYRNIPEIFIKAQPRSKAIKKSTMRYFLYTEYRMTRKYSTEEIKVNKEYFETYKSGNISNQKQVGKKFIIAFIAFLVFFLTIFSYFVYTIYFVDTVPTDTPLTTQRDKNISSSVDNTNLNIPNNSGRYNDFEEKEEKLNYMQLICSPQKKYCLYKKQKINFDFYLLMKKEHNFKEYAVSKLLGDFMLLDVFVTNEFYQIYNKGFNNEKNYTNTITNTKPIF